jgi:hypothetical protein
MDKLKENILFLESQLKYSNEKLKYHRLQNIKHKLGESIIDDFKYELIPNSLDRLINDFEYTNITSLDIKNIQFIDYTTDDNNVVIIKYNNILKHLPTYIYDYSHQIYKSEIITNWSVTTNLSMLDKGSHFIITYNNDKCITNPIGIILKYTNELKDDIINQNSLNELPEFKNYKKHTKYNTIDINYDIIGLSKDKFKIFNKNITFKKELIRENGIIYFNWDDLLFHNISISYLVFKNNVKSHKGSILSKFSLIIKKN